MIKSIFGYFVGPILILVLMAGCDSRQSEFSALLDKAERYIDTRPDSAMVLIDSLFYFEGKSRREEGMRYLVLRAQTLHENHFSLTADTLVFDAADYYSRHDKNRRLTAMAYLYSGYTCHELGDYDRAEDYFRKAEAMGGPSFEKSMKIANLQIENQLVYEKNYEDELRRFKKMHIAQNLRSRNRTYTYMYILFFVFVVLVLILVGMLSEKNAKLKMRENIAVLRETTKDLLETQDLNHGRSPMAQELLQWKFEVMKKTFLLKHGMSEGIRKENKILLGFLDKIVFGQDSETALPEFLSVIEDLSPGLICFIKERYPDISEKEYNVYLLSVAGLDVKKISLLLGQSENSIYKFRSAFNKKFGSNFWPFLKEEFERNNHKSN